MPSGPGNAPLAAILDDIRRHWELVVAPNADPRKWDRELAAAVAGYSVWNLTDFNYDKCHTYVIPAHRADIDEPGSAEADRALIARLGGRRHDVLLKLSVVLPYYLVALLEREVDAGGAIVERLSRQPTAEQSALAGRVEDFARRQGAAVIPRELLCELVPGAELELADPGTVTVYNCLFDDQDNSSPPIFCRE